MRKGNGYRKVGSEGAERGDMRQKDREQRKGTEAERLEGSFSVDPFPCMGEGGREGERECAA